ncbi:lysophospholipase [Malassezia sp. CBS 17886]|nr:lysophospholipase [Malassezia sp. CBS 17886]
MMPMLKTVIVPPAAGGMPSATVFMLHGLGDTAYGWVDVAHILGRNQALQHIRFVLPTAPMQPVTINMGMKMNSWFDIYSLNDLNRGEDEAGLLNGAQGLLRLVQEETDGSAEGLNGHKVPADRIVLAGFSQGGAVALLSALLSPLPIAGVGALSTWLPLQEKIEQMRKRTGPFPVFQAHGTADSVVNIALGRMTHELLSKQLGFGKLDEFHEYPGMAHSACPEEIRDWGNWLSRVLPL